MVSAYRTYRVRRSRISARRQYRSGVATTLRGLTSDSHGHVLLPRSCRMTKGKRFSIVNGEAGCIPSYSSDLLTGKCFQENHRMVCQQCHCCEATRGWSIRYRVQDLYASSGSLALRDHEGRDPVGNPSSS